MTTREGGRFTNTTIQNIIKRPIYIGILSSGGVQSGVIPELQIVSQDMFDRAREIASERSADYTDRRIPLNTKGDALLSGNVFCGHCGARLTLTTNGKKYFRKDGDVTVTPKTRYVCYNKTRHPERCDGQTGYTTSKLDGVVEQIVSSIFSKIKEQPGEQIIAAQFEERIADSKSRLEQARTALNNELQILSMLENELLKVIQGTSLLKPEMLNKRHDDAELAVAEKRAIVERLETELANSQDTMCQVKRQYNDVLSWADMYSASPIDVKKMIVAQLIRAVRVSQDYKIEIDLRISEHQLGLDKEHEAERKPKRSKRRNEPEL